MKKSIMILVLVLIFTTTLVGTSLNLYASTEDKVYISDLPGIEHILIDSPGITDGINKGLVGESDTLIVNDVLYSKGFCTHPVSGDTPSEITVNVSEYTADKPILHLLVGKDDGAAGGAGGHPFIYEVQADGNSIYLSDQLEYGQQEEIFLNVAGAQEITLLCHAAGPFAWLTVNFVDVYLCDLAIKEVSLAKAPLKVEYVTGEALSVVGGKLKVVYENDFEVELDIESSMVSGFDSSVAGEQELTITYEEQTFTYKVNVKAASTAAPTTVPTTAPTTAPTTEPDGNKGGCGSSAAIAQVMLVLGAALIIKKRK